MSSEKMSRALPIILITSMFVFCIEIDVSIPSFPDMVNFFGTSQAMVQSTLSLNFIAFFLSGLVYGPLSSAYGRRPIYIWGTVIFMIGSLGCAFSDTIEWMLGWRFFQGLGASSAGIITYAMIADVYKAEKAASFHGMMNATLTLAMAGAPILGGYLNQGFGWRAPYTFVGVASLLTFFLLWARLPETLKEIPGKLCWESLRKDYFSVLSRRAFLVLMFAPSLFVAGYFGFVASLPFLYVTDRGMDLSELTLHQAVVILSFSVVSFFTGKINGWLGMMKSLFLGSFVSAFFALVLLYVGFQEMTPFWFTAVMFMLSMGIALCFGTATALSLDLPSRLIGVGSALVMAFRMLIGGGAIGLAGYFYDRSMFSVAIMVALPNLAAAAILILLQPIYRPAPKQESAT
ncbi:MAG: multidrug effflux MFS transporter [bacterium]|nr:multidrug effflux MFS transporter [bacterium]